jgi:hypothetical protein
LYKRQAVLDVVRIGAEAANDLRVVTGFNEKELVFRDSSLQKLVYHLPRVLQLRAHATAGIKHNSDLDRLWFDLLSIRNDAQGHGSEEEACHNGSISNRRA